MSPPTKQIIDAWTQPALPQGFVHLPEVTRLFKQSGTADLLRTGVTSEEMVLQMDAAGIGMALLSAWHRPGKWVFSNDQVAEFIDTSAYLPRYYPLSLIHFLKTYGKGKVLFGTNFPQLPFGKCVEQARALDLSEDARTAFFRENARRVFKL